MSAIIFSPTIGPVALNVFVKEAYRTEIGITSNPIETGAEVNDHAYVKPKRLTIDTMDDQAAATFNALVAFQESRVPFTIVAGLAVWSNMLIASIDAQRDEQFATVLKATVELQEVIIVDTSYSASTDETQENRGSPGGTKSSRSAAPAPRRSGDAATADRAAGTVTRGDSPTKAAPTTGTTPEATRNRSFLSRL